VEERDYINENPVLPLDLSEIHEHVKLLSGNGKTSDFWILNTLLLWV
jgi:hypothetical protein